MNKDLYNSPKNRSTPPKEEVKYIAPSKDNKTMRASVLALKAQKDSISQNLLNDIIGSQSAVNPGAPPDRKSIKRGSMAYTIAGGEDISELKIENDRMKTTIMILS